MILIDNEFLPQAQAMVEMARRTIDISTFKAEITSKPRGVRLFSFFQKLFEKRAAGVQVRFLLNYNDERRAMPHCNVYAFHELKQRKIDVRKLTGNRCCHAKILLIDRSKAIVGSHNLSVKSCHNNFETSYLVMEPVSVSRLARVFDHVFDLSTEV